MKEIKFRGKSDVEIGEKIIQVGEWVYGGIAFDEDRVWIDTPYLGQIIVDRETVGQYTGLKDKNDVEIYEGDIIRTFCDKGYGKRAKKVEIISQVIYCVDNGKTIGGLDTNYFSGFDTKQLNKQDWTNCDWSMFFECEVIGNIYENPELLEVENEK